MPSLVRPLLSALLFPALAIAQITAPASSKATQTNSSTSSAGWQKIHNSALIVDTHADTPGRFVDENFDLSQDAGKGYMDFNKIKAGVLELGS